MVLTVSLTSLTLSQGDLAKSLSGAPALRTLRLQISSSNEARPKKDCSYPADWPTPEMLLGIVMQALPDLQLLSLEFTLPSVRIAARRKASVLENGQQSGAEGNKAKSFEMVDFATVSRELDAMWND